MATQYQIDTAVGLLHQFIDEDEYVRKSEIAGLKTALSLLLAAYRELRQRDADVTTIMIHALAQGVELRKSDAEKVVIREQSES